MKKYLPISLSLLWLLIYSAKAQNLKKSSSFNAEAPLSLHLLDKGSSKKLKRSSDVPAVRKNAKWTLLKSVDDGIQIRLEKSGTDSSVVTPSVSAPWLAKPVLPAPKGWRFVPAPKSLLAYEKRVDLKSGKKVGFSITPFVLVPDRSSQQAVRILESGFDVASLQPEMATVGAMLEHSTVELKANERQASLVITQLQRLLSSLPK